MRRGRQCPVFRTKGDRQAMAARVIAMTGPAGSGKTERFLARYRKALGQFAPRSTLWLAPTWRAAAAVQDRLMAGTLRGKSWPVVEPIEGFFVKGREGPLQDGELQRAAAWARAIAESARKGA